MKNFLKDFATGTVFLLLMLVFFMSWAGLIVASIVYLKDSPIMLMVAIGIWISVTGGLIMAIDNSKL